MEVNVINIPLVEVDCEYHDCIYNRLGYCKRGSITINGEGCKDYDNAN